MGDGLEEPLVSFLVGRDHCAGRGLVGNQQWFLMKKQRSPSKAQRMVPVNPWGGCPTPQLARTLGESLVALQKKAWWKRQLRWKERNLSQAESTCTAESKTITAVPPGTEQGMTEAPKPWRRRRLRCQGNVGRSIAHFSHRKRHLFLLRSQVILLQVCLSTGLSFTGKPEWLLVNLK
jgi:hypothetical protein